MIQVGLYRAVCDFCSREKVGDVQSLVADLATWLVAGPLAICDSHYATPVRDEPFLCESCGVSRGSLFAGHCHACWVRAAHASPSRQEKVRRVLEHRFVKDACACGQRGLGDPERQVNHLIDVLESEVPPQQGQPSALGIF